MSDKSSKEIADEMDKLGKDSERLGKAYAKSGGDEQIGEMSRLASERWSQLNMDYQLKRATGR